MLRTSVGYADGDSINPTYHNLGNHTESIQVVYDPAVISYRQLLDVFWDSHNPTARPWSRQYKSIIFYHDDKQQNTALDAKRQREYSLNRKIHTEVRPFSAFYPAEDYHQKYYLQNEPDVFSEYAAIYPDFNQIVASTAAARVNGYLGGYWQSETLLQQLSLLGLSKAGQQKMMQIGNRLLR